MTKTHAVAFYGTTKYKQLKPTTYKQRYVKVRKDGVKQRYWRKVTRSQRVSVLRDSRITLWGSAEDVGRAKEKIDREKWIPKKKYVDGVSAKDFLERPEKYVVKGEWVDRREKHSP